MGHAAHLHLDSSDGPGSDAWRGYDELVVELCVLHFFSGSVQKVTRDCLCYRKDVVDYCPRYFDEILQVLKLKTQTKAASRARIGCGLVLESSVTQKGCR